MIGESFLLIGNFDRHCKTTDQCAADGVNPIRWCMFPPTVKPIFRHYPHIEYRGSQAPRALLVGLIGPSMHDSDSDRMDVTHEPAHLAGELRRLGDTGKIEAVTNGTKFRCFILPISFGRSEKFGGSDRNKQGSAGPQTIAQRAIALLREKVPRQEFFQKVERRCYARAVAQIVGRERLFVERAIIDDDKIGAFQVSEKIDAGLNALEIARAGDPRAEVQIRHNRRHSLGAPLNGYHQ